MHRHVWNIILIVNIHDDENMKGAISMNIPALSFRSFHSSNIIYYFRSNLSRQYIFFPLFPSSPMFIIPMTQPEGLKTLLFTVEIFAHINPKLTCPFLPFNLLAHEKIKIRKKKIRHLGQNNPHSNNIIIIKKKIEQNHM